jgi:hypothetical protein
MDPHLFINGHYVSQDPGQLQHLSNQVNPKAPARKLNGRFSKVFGDAWIGVFSSLPDKKNSNAQPASSCGAWYRDSSEVNLLGDTECHRSPTESVNNGTPQNQSERRCIMMKYKKRWIKRGFPDKTNAAG